MSMFNKVTKTFQWGQHTVTLETGEIARQSSGAVVVTMDDTVVLATVVAKTEAKAGQDFFPLTVDYIEKTYAAGKIPGSFFKREGRPSELETLTSRLIDRPIRPLFPEGFFNEVQVVVHVLSLNPEVQADIAGADRHQRGAGHLRHPVQRPDRRGPRRLHRRPVRAQPGQDAARRQQARAGRCRHRGGRADGRVRSRPTERRSDARRRGLRSRPGQHRDRRDQRAGARSRQARVARGRRRPRTSRSSPPSMRWPSRRCARPTRSAASRPARRPVARPPPT